MNAEEINKLIETISTANTRQEIDTALASVRKAIVEDTDGTISTQVLSVLDHTRLGRCPGVGHVRFACLREMSLEATKVIDRFRLPVFKNLAATLDRPDHKLDPLLTAPLEPGAKFKFNYPDYKSMTGPVVILDSLSPIVENSKKPL